ncbi:zinc finger and BTB domain-containing protein 34 [Lampetra fluviatilis]
MTTDVSEAIPFMAACHGPTILAELNRLRLDGQLCDITLHVAGHAFGAHKAVLAASCPYFRDHAGLQGLSALHVGVVRSPRVFAQLLAFCYTGRLVLTRREILAFLTAASFLQLQPVIDRCVQLLAGMLSPTSHLTDSSHDSPGLLEPSPPPPPPPPPRSSSSSCDRPLLPSTPPAHVPGSHGPPPAREDELPAGGGASCGGSEASSWTELGWPDGFVQGSSPEDVTFPPAVSRHQHHQQQQQQQRHRYHQHQQQQQQQLVLLPSRRPRKSATSVRLQIKTEPPDEQMRRDDLDDDDDVNDVDDDDEEEGGNYNNSAAEEEEENEVVMAEWVGDGGGDDRDEKPAARRRRKPRVIQHADLAARRGLLVPRAFSLAPASLAPANAAANAGVIRARSTSPQQHPASADLSPHSDGALPSAAAYADYLQSAAGGGGGGDDCGAASVTGATSSSAAAAAPTPTSGQERWMRYNPRLTCLYCGKSFNQKGSLDRHMRLHMGITPFACRHCGKRYTRKDQLEYHIRTHTGNKPFPCALCGKCFPFQATLNQHVRKNHGRGEGGRALRGGDDGGRADGGGGGGEEVEEMEEARAEVAPENDVDRSANS